jgi:hypothetical protein
MYRIVIVCQDFFSSEEQAVFLSVRMASSVFAPALDMPNTTHSVHPEAECRINFRG